MAVHLSIIFTMQSLVVVAAFAVVIWLLTNQQHVDLQKAVFRNIDQQQETTRDSLLAPFLKFETPVRRYGERIKAFPSTLQCLPNSTISSVSEFYEAVILDVIRDPEYRSFSQFYDSGSTVWGGCAVGFAGSGNSLQIEVSSGSAKQRADVMQPLPVMYGTVDANVPADYNIASSSPSGNPSTSSGAISQLKMQSSGSWSPGALFVNTNRRSETDYSVQYLLPLRFDSTNQTILGIAASFVMTNISETIESAKISDNARVMLYETKNAALMATTLETVPLLKNGDEQWPMFDTPDPDMNTALAESMRRCQLPSCQSVTYLTADNVVSLRHIITPTNISMALLQVIPEGYFFEKSRTTRLNGIFVGAAAAVVIVISCVIIWLAVYGPLNALQDNMGLAANMQNDKVTSRDKRPCCILYEIAMLNECFDKMNDKLLLARAYMPQALLVGVGGSSAEDEDDDDDDDEGHLNIDGHQNNNNRSGRKDRGGGAHRQNNDDDDDEDEGDPMNLSLSHQRETNSLSGSRRSPQQQPLGGQHHQARSGGADKYMLNRSGGNNNPAASRSGGNGNSGSHSYPPGSPQGQNNNNNNKLKDSKKLLGNSGGHRGGAAADNMSESSMRSTAKKNAKYTLTLSRAITNRRIGILIVNGRDFHRVVSEPNANVTQLHQEVVELVEGSSKAEKGVIDAFHGDHFVITFNAAMAVGAPAKGAALCALRIQNNVRARTALPGVTMGLSAGLAMVGTLGSADMKKFCMLSPAFSQAIALETAAKRVVGIASCLFSMRLAGDLDMHVYSQVVGQKYLCGTNINVTEGKVVNIGGIMGAITTQGDEWLYELEEGASKNPYAKINAAYELFLAKQYDRCVELLSAGYPEKSDAGMVANWERLTEILNTDSNEWQL